MLNQTEQEILELSKYDPLAVAESITDNSYKGDKDTGMLGLALSMMKNNKMRELQESVDDTGFSHTTEDYLRIVGNFGFKVVYAKEFEGTSSDDGPSTDTHYILFHKEYGLILNFDTYGDSVNGGHLYYNWSPNDPNYRYDLTSSGGMYFVDRKDMNSHVGLFEPDMMTPYVIPDYPLEPLWDIYNTTWEDHQIIAKPIQEEQHRLMNIAIAEGKRCLWVGDHDCRESIITKIKALLNAGKFFPIWHGCQFNWLTNYMDHKKPMNYPYTEHYEQTRDIIVQLPEDVQKCINNTYRA